MDHIQQLSLFRLEPRNEGKEKIDWSKGGIKSLHLERFKGFKKFDVDFDRITLLVGTNSSGKTTILQAIRLFYWCILKCKKKVEEGYSFVKGVIPYNDFHLIPSHELRELAFQGTSPNSRTRGIVLKGILANGLSLSFRIYSSYSTLMVINPENQKGELLSDKQIAEIDRAPLYIPGFFGVVNRELLAHDARLEELLNSGHHNEVLRNIILRLKGDQSRNKKLLEIMQNEFLIKKMDLPFSEKTTEFLKAEYVEPGIRIPLDFVSAGSGFLQVLQIMAHALQNPSPILLLDEPDAHMHHSLQKTFLKVLRKFADDEDLQVIMASHSETFIREILLSEIRVIDSLRQAESKFVNPVELQEELSQAGIWPSNFELAEILRTKRVLLVESGEDEACLHALGRLRYADWDNMARMFQIIYSEGSDYSTVQRIEFVQQILSKIVPGGVKVAHMRDRDLFCDEAISTILEEAKNKKVPVFISNRRNRESILADPDLVERAVRKEYGNALHDNLKTDGAIATLVKDEILVWCNQEVDEIPVKIREYNQSWIRKAFDHNEWRDSQKILDSFVRLNWQEPLIRKEIPWKLVDGKTALRRIRKKLHQYKINLSEEMLFNAMVENDYDDHMKRSVDLVYSWLSD
jgi:predicted ATP-dependent endonuclease of OLD family